MIMASPPSPPPPSLQQPPSNVESRWEANEGTYLHKKFKKVASSSAPQPPPPPKPYQQQPPQKEHPVLKHSALSMLSHNHEHSDFRIARRPVESDTTTDADGERRRKQHLCPFCNIACTKPSVLDKHIRTHTNERPYPCDPCGFAFKTKSNLYKHRKSRTHVLKVENGIDSSGAEIVAELGEGLHEEMDHQQHHIYNSSPHPTVGGGGGGDEYDDDNEDEAGALPPHRLQLLSKDLVKPTQTQPTDLSNKGYQQQSLQQRIDKVISENQAIVETLDPLWPRRYMRQNSKDNNESFRGSGSGRKYNMTSTSPTSIQQPLNLSSTESSSSVKKRPLNIGAQDNITAKSVKELWLNSCRQSVSSRTSSSSEVVVIQDARNASSFHPENPEGSMIKELLLKTRAGIPITTTVTTSQTTKQMGTLPKSNRIVQPVTNSDATTTLVSTATSTISCNLCSTNFCGIDLEIHQRFYCPAIRNNKSPSPPQKRPRSEYGHIPTTSSLIVNSTTPTAAAVSTMTTALSSSIPGIPTPNLTGVLTGIKSSIPLFSLPGKRNFDSSSLVTMVSTTATTSSEIKISSSSSSTISLPLPPSESKTRDSQLVENNSLKIEVENGKFLRPTSLSLLPGSFPSKKAVMSTIFGNGSTLASPETPRPRKSYVLQYQNGTAYTYLGFKSTTRVYYCSIFRPQPMYVANKPRLSMYSNWRVVTKDSHPSGLTPIQGLAAYNSDSKDRRYIQSRMKREMISTHSSMWKKKPPKTISTDNEAAASSSSASSYCNKTSSSTLASTSMTSMSTSALINKDEETRRVEGGYKTTDEDYTYVRGRGRGRYVCDSCGIRCKKPSMLKKHIRTHSNFRPFMCKFCNFAFKTKGNLTKHMKSKAHHKKCVELGISPVPTTVDDSQIDDATLAKQGVLSGNGTVLAGDSDSDLDDDMDDDDDDDEDQFEDAEEETQQQQEAAQSLLSLHNQTTYKNGCDDYQGLFPSELRMAISTSSNPLQQQQQQQMVLSININAISEHVSRNTKRAGEFQDENNSGVKFTVDKIYFPPLLNDAKEASVVVATPAAATAATTITTTTTSHTTSTIITTQQQVSSAIAFEQFKLVAKPSDNHQPQQQLLQQQPQKQQQQDFSRERAAARTVISNNNNCKTEIVQQRISNNTVAGVPRNVVMNVKDIPNKDSTSVVVTTPPDIVVPTHPRPVAKAEEFSDSGSTTNPSSSSSGNATAQQEIFQTNEDGKSVCGICHKVFSKPSQLRLHVNIHYFERPFRCDACAVSFRTKGHLQKHKRSVGHFNKVNINATFGAPTTANPRPFKCSDCKVAFRIHGHLAKHLRSKMHIMKLECSGKLPIGMFAEMERLGTNLNEIDTSDCENSLESLQQIAVKLYKKDPSKLTAPDDMVVNPPNSDISDTEEDQQQLLQQQQQPEVKKEHSDNPAGGGGGGGSSQQQFREPPPQQPSAPRQSSFTSSGQEEPAIDSENENNGLQPPSSSSSIPSVTLLQCTKCKTSFNDIKSLQIHNFLEHPSPSDPNYPPPPHHPHQQQPISLSPPRRDPHLYHRHPRHMQPPLPPPSALPQQTQSHHRVQIVHQSAVAAAAAAAAQAAATITHHNNSTRSNGLISVVTPTTTFNEDKNAYNCELCGVAVIGTTSFKQHLMSHASPRPFVCTECDAGFPSNRQLEVHMQLHIKK